MASPTTDRPNGGRHEAVEPKLRDQVFGRRKFLAYLVAGSTLTVAAKVGFDTLAPGTASAVIPSGPQPADVIDLGDILILGGKPTEDLLIRSRCVEDGRVTVELPRMEVGQGITTAVAMLVADELDVPLSQIVMPLAPPGPELLFGPAHRRLEHHPLGVRPGPGGRGAARGRLLRRRVGAAARPRRATCRSSTASWSAPARPGPCSASSPPPPPPCRSGSSPPHPKTADGLQARRQARNRGRRPRDGHRASSSTPSTSTCPGALPHDGAPPADHQRHGAGRSTTRPRSATCPACSTSP